MNIRLYLSAVVLTAFCCQLLSAADTSYTNWENHPIHPIDSNPSNTMLAVANTADNRVQLFDISLGTPKPVGHITVGVDPVSVRFRTETELWVVNHISDSVSIIDIPSRRVMKTLSTADEPFDVVFAGNPQKGFVSCSQANMVQAFDVVDPNAAPIEIPINAEDPRAMAVSADGSTVYVAIFESGNASTSLAGATRNGASPPNIVGNAETPYAGMNPPPNDGGDFSPAKNPELPTAPRSAHIVKKDISGRWMDGNQQDWSQWISGDDASKSGRVIGWDMPDHDIAVIDAATMDVSYLNRLMNIGMAIAVHPTNGTVHLVGTDATNEVRFEPNVKGRFLRVNIGSVDTLDPDQKQILDLNPHLDYIETTIEQAQRDLSIGDPRSIVWATNGKRAYVAGMGSNNVIMLNEDGSRNTELAPIRIGEGPIGLVINEAKQLLYVWNHFEASISVVDLVSHEETSRVAAHSPVPDTIRKGRKHFYNTHKSSGLGQIACASCHVDGRMDRLAWDLGSPAGTMKEFNQNCFLSVVGPDCEDFHPMKGPMLTQTLQNIIGHEPLHWRGDREGLEAFNGAFISLQGDDTGLSTEEMGEFKDFLDTITFPPNPFRELDNSLSTKVSLAGQLSPGGSRFLPVGEQLPDGNAKTGLSLFTDGRLALIPNSPARPQNCTACHSLPTGMSPNATARDPFADIVLGGSILPAGPNGENHLLVHAASSLTAMTIKVPQLRNLYERIGFESKSTSSRAGFGFFHDGAVDSLARFASLFEFDVEDTQQMVDLLAFLMSFSGSDLPTDNPSFNATLTDTKDSHAAVGQQQTMSSSASNATLDQLVLLAQQGSIDLVAHQSDGKTSRSWLYVDNEMNFEPDDSGTTLTLNQLLGKADEGSEITFSALPAGTGVRVALDRDGDGIKNAVEILQGSDPADAQSTLLTPQAGNWYNPARNGSGIDLEKGGGKIWVVTWYTYNEDGSSHWYQATGELEGNEWSGELYQVTWEPVESKPIVSYVGTLAMTFSDRRHANFAWTIGEKSGVEAYEKLVFSNDFTPYTYSGLWNDPGEPGWGISVDSLGSRRATLVFFYDEDNQPRWVIGAGDNASGTTYSMLSVQGFCPWCEAVQTSNVPGGSMTINFNSSPPSVEMDVFYAAKDNSNWKRNAVLSKPTVTPFDPYAG